MFIYEAYWLRSELCCPKCKLKIPTLENIYFALQSTLDRLDFECIYSNKHRFHSSPVHRLLQLLFLIWFKKSNFLNALYYWRRKKNTWTVSKFPFNIEVICSWAPNIVAVNVSALVVNLIFIFERKYTRSAVAIAPISVNF